MSMIRDFKYFTISFFIGCDFDIFQSVTKQLKREQLALQKIRILKNKLNIESYFNSPAGGAHYPHFSFWTSLLYPRIVFFISNYEDGLTNLCHIIHSYVKGNMVICTFSNELYMEYPGYHFHYSDTNFTERTILAYKEDKWVFYEQGKPLAFENTDYYKNRLIKKRLNNKIIEEYLLKLGINIWDIDSQVDQCITYQQNAW